MFHDPAFGQIGSFNDLYVNLSQDIPHGQTERQPLVATIGVKLQQEGIQTEPGVMRALEGAVMGRALEVVVKCAARFPGR
jgi:hypothetical protein